ncbi:ADP-ribosylglycohydrolase family protein [Modicisalibacter luteus]|uniref:ADP-ribosylglycohydrolase family protein n=1 Tax=Modicisalibacter luteus TaxID=453962 RepID=UPI003631E7CE
MTGDTQTMLFTAEGMLRAYIRIQERDIYDPVAAIHHALIRWAITQGITPSLSPIDDEIGLVTDERLHQRRSPDATSLAALEQSPALTWQPYNKVNHCAALTRAAPIGLFPWSDFLLRHRERAFSVASETARLTHGHPCAYLSAGVFAYLINGLLESEQPLETLLPQALAFMESGACIDFYIADDEERASLPRCQARIRFLLEAVLDFHAQGSVPSPQGIEMLGTDRSAQVSLAVAVWCALAARDYREGALWAVNHAGDSKGIGLLAGNLLGLKFGLGGLPQAWLEVIELRKWMDVLGHDLQWLPQVYVGHGYGEYDDELRQRYPPS